MITQTIYLPTWDWGATIFYCPSRVDNDTILQALRVIGCKGKSLRDASDNLYGGGVNTGLTYTNNRNRWSVMVIGKPSSPVQFWNTVDHEKGHLVQHISRALSLDPDGEERQYLGGELAEKMFPVCRLFVCSKDRPISC